jgi:hypothetical protein
MKGDVDGDGGNDILTNSVELAQGAVPISSVYLIPSTPKTPE